MAILVLAGSPVRPAWGRTPTDRADRAEEDTASHWERRHREALRKRKQGIVLSTVGWPLFIGGYFAALAVTDVFGHSDSADMYKVASPVIGPYWAAIASPGGGEGGQIFFGLVESTGLATGIAGLVVLAKANRELDRTSRFVFSPTRGGGVLSLVGRF